MHTPPQGPNLIMFMPSPGQNVAAQQVPDRRSEPKEKRSPRRRKTRSDWQLNQRQFEQNQSQEISHILLQELIVPEVFNMGGRAQCIIPAITHKRQSSTRKQTVMYSMW